MYYYLVVVPSLSKVIKPLVNGNYWENWINDKWLITGLQLTSLNPDAAGLSNAAWIVHNELGKDNNEQITTKIYSWVFYNLL